MEECKKIKLTEQEGDAELRRMVENNDWRVWKRKTNCRKYECPKCGKGVYHLGSKSSITIY